MTWILVLSLDLLKVSVENHHRCYSSLHTLGMYNLIWLEIKVLVKKWMPIFKATIIEMKGGFPTQHL